MAYYDELKFNNDLDSPDTEEPLPDIETLPDPYFDLEESEPLLDL